MEPAVEKVGDVALVTLPMEALDASNCEEFAKSVSPILQETNKVVFDVGKLRFVDSSGLKTILWCQKQLTAAQGDLKLCGMTARVRSLFELVRIHRILDILGTREEAVGAFQQKS